jgi:hypothetical protein
MATQSDVRKIALSLPGAEEESGRFAFHVIDKGKKKGFAWVWLERVDPKKARVPNPEVLAVRVSGLEEKAALIAGDSEKFFTEPHYNGYPAVLVRLRAIKVPELRQLLTEAYRRQAPRKINAAWHEKHVMPKKASAEQRLAWHVEHQEHCGCRPMPASLQTRLAQR